MKLKEGYSLVWGDTVGNGCGSGGYADVDVVYHGAVVRTLRTCPCGRGCANRDCVVDDWGRHDTDIEDIRADVEVSE